MVKLRKKSVCSHLMRLSFLSLLPLLGCEPPIPKASTASDESKGDVVANMGGAQKKKLSPKELLTSNLERKKHNFSVEFLSWNLESEGSEPSVIAQELAEMKRYDVYALSEVLPAAGEVLQSSLGVDFNFVMSKSGYNDRLAIAYDRTLFEEIKSFEIREINFQNHYRAPLVVRLKHKQTALEFLVMNNHLARGKAPVRQRQATQLVQWARKQLAPVVALGDYNFDYEFETEKGNAAFSNMLKDGVWQWVKPEQWIDTNWYDNPREPDGRDDYPGSMLDFAFVSGPAKGWRKRCRVIVRDGDFPDDERTSDHRPIELVVSNAKSD